MYNVPTTNTHVSFCSMFICLLTALFFFIIIFMVKPLLCNFLFINLMISVLVWVDFIFIHSFNTHTHIQGETSFLKSSQMEIKMRFIYFLKAKVIVLHLIFLLTSAIALLKPFSMYWVIYLHTFKSHT